MTQILLYVLDKLQYRVAVLVLRVYKNIIFTHMDKLNKYDLTKFPFSSRDNKNEGLLHKR